MSHINFTALRHIAAGHTVDTAYDLDFEMSNYNTSGRTDRRINKTINGTRETVRMYDEMSADVTVAVISEANLELWEEWFFSVDNDESFTFDAWGSSAVPDNPVAVRLDGDRFQPQRIKDSDFFTLAFKLAI